MDSAVDKRMRLVVLFPADQGSSHVAIDMSDLGTVIGLVSEFRCFFIPLHCRVVVAKALLIVANRDGQLQCRSLIFFILRLIPRLSGVCIHFGIE